MSDQELKFHPYCLAFPETSPEEFAKLKESIQEHGQRDAIVLLGGEILDGRTRYKAVRELKIPPQFRQYDPVKDGQDPLAWVIDKNLHRRHLTVGQRAALAVQLEALIKEAKSKAKTDAKPAEKPTPNAPDGGKVLEFPTVVDGTKDKEAERPRTEAAAAAGVSTGSVAKAKDLAENDPAAFEKVKSGEVTLDKASKESKAQRQDSVAPPLPGADVPPVDPYRRQTADMLAPSMGDKFADAVRAGTVLKDKELKEFMKLAVQDQKQIVPLVSTGWKVRQAVKFVKGMFEQDDAIRELLNLAIMRGGTAVTTLAGHTILIVSDDTLGRTEWATIKARIGTIRAEQAKPENATPKVDNTLGKAMEQAKPAGKPATNDEKAEAFAKAAVAATGGGVTAPPAKATPAKKSAAPASKASAAKPPAATAGKPASGAASTKQAAKKAAKPAAKPAAKVPAKKAAKAPAKKAAKAPAKKAAKPAGKKAAKKK